MTPIVRHCGPATLDDKQQRFRRGLPFQQLAILSREAHHVGRDIAKEDELFAAGNAIRLSNSQTQPDERSNISSSLGYPTRGGWAGKRYAGSEAI
jgi:hypothetical protein